MNISKLTSIILSAGLAMTFVGCGNKQEAVIVTPESTPTSHSIIESTTPSGTYFSEMTGLPISTELQEQRPIAVMVDCEQVALPSYGLAEADVVYDLRNSMINDYVTRFMALYKDYNSVPQIGSIRSTRPTNVWLAGEWNAIICHDGTDPEADELIQHDFAQQHLSGCFSRLSNGKATEFTEYILSGDVDSAISSYGLDKNYNQYKLDGNHFNFVKYNTSLNVSSFKDANSITLPFSHNGTTLAYNTETKSYDLSMYGEIHKDAEDDKILTFTNVLLISCDYHEITIHNIQYHIVDNGGDGYYITNGKAEPITWKKGGENEITHYYDASGNDLQMNRGKTYINLVPSDTWNELSIQ